MYQILKKDTLIEKSSFFLKKLPTFAVDKKKNSPKNSSVYEESKSGSFKLQLFKQSECSSVSSPKMNKKENISFENKEETSQTLLSLDKPSRLSKPLKTILEQATQEKIQKTFLEINENKVINPNRKLNKDLKRKKMKNYRKKKKINEIVEKNRSLIHEINKKNDISYNKLEKNSFFAYLEEGDINERAFFDSLNSNYSFLDENFTFFEACLFNNKTFIESKHFRINSSFSLLGDINKISYLKLNLKFISETKIDDFVISLKKTENLLIVINPKIVTNENEKEKLVEIYFFETGLVEQPPEAIISTKLEKEKYLTILFKLPLLMNRFFIIEDMSDLSCNEFYEIWNQCDYHEKILESVNQNYIFSFSSLCELFESHLLLDTNKIATRLQLLNHENKIMNLIVEYKQENSKISLIFCFGVEKSLKDTSDKTFMDNLAKKMIYIFEKLFKDFKKKNNSYIVM